MTPELALLPLQGLTAGVTKYQLTGPIESGHRKVAAFSYALNTVHYVVHCGVVPQRLHKQ